VLVLTVLVCVRVAEAAPKDPGLEQAKKTFEQKMKQIDEEAAKGREKATAKLREEYAELISRKRKAGDDEAVAFFTREAKELLGDDGAKGVEGFKKLRKRMPLTALSPMQKQGDVQFKTDHDKNVPLIDGRPTTEPFLWSPSPSSSSWPIPTGAKVFEAHADNLFPGGVPHNANCFMEVFVDGKSVAKTTVMNPASNVEKVVVELPRGGKVLTLVTDPHQGGIDYDWCVWVEPAFYDR
jgi:vacuolar-type H+-ATPase subunit H